MLRKFATAILDRSSLTMRARIHNGRDLYVDMSNTVGRSIYWRGTYEPNIERVLRESLKDGDTFVDAGANVGYFSLIAADIVGASGMVISVEPNLSLCRLLRATVRRNGYANWNVVPAGVGSHAGVGKLQIQQSSGVSFIGEKLNKGDKVREIQITPVLTLDEVLGNLLPNMPPPTVIKVDVEGLELRVLEGAKNTIAKRKTKFIVEHSESNQARFGISKLAISDFMESHGYVPMPISSACLDWNRSDVLWYPET